MVSFTSRNALGSASRKDFSNAGSERCGIDELQCQKCQSLDFDHVFKYVHGSRGRQSHLVWRRVSLVVQPK